MKLLWMLLKLVIALALVIPVAIIVLATVLGIFGALLGLAVLALRIAVLGLIGWGVFRLGTALFRGSGGRSRPVEMKPLSAVDPYYEAARRELDRELGEVK